MKLPNNAFHAPLHPLDSESRTHACRQTKPSSCAKHSLPGVCAFVRQDNICLSPPRSWKKQFLKLLFQHFGKQTQTDEIKRASDTRQPAHYRAVPNISQTAAPFANAASKGPSMKAAGQIKLLVAS